MSQRKIRIVARRRSQPDYQKLSRALLALFAAQNEADAEAAARAKGRAKNIKTPGSSSGAS